MRLVFLVQTIIAPALVVLAVTPLIRSIRILDHPNARRIHNRPTPKSGGIAIFFAVAVSLAMKPLQRPSLVLLGLLAITSIVGLLDDIAELRPRSKLLLQFLVAILTIASGHRFRLMGGVWDYAITFLWFVGYMNSFNLIDGLDGLAACTAILQMGALGLAAQLGGRSEIWGLTLPLIFAGLAFLIYNWHPASIFMGDTGSQLMGFLVAFTGVQYQSGVSPNLGWGSAFLVLCLTFFPLFDTTLSIIRRKANGVSIFAPDRSHSYNILVDRYGFSQPKVVLMISTISLAADAVALLLFQLYGNWAMVASALVLCATVLILSYRSDLAQVDERHENGIVVPNQNTRRKSS